MRKPRTMQEILDRAIDAALRMTEEEQMAYLRGIAERWDNQANVDYVIRGVLGT
ncbi:MAG: hypothetical protein F6K04_23865 [Leptolyngbya sp. SIO4C5]|nr:hypothetical protein [Leptolyngbya sp. SIO4C5]